MSPHLFTFLITKYPKFTKIAKTGQELNIYSTNPSKAEALLQMLTDSFDYLATIFKPAYPLSKLDIFLEPSIGWAMEHWGLIVYGGNPDRSIMQHLVAHQWFGNLVSPSAWKHAWLSEGFATYWEKQVAKEAPATFERELYIVIDNDRGLVPMVLEPFVTLRDLERYPWLRYEKGACLLKMIEGMIGQQPLIDAMNKYLEKYQYEAVETSLFFDELLSAFDKIRDKMDGISIQELGKQWTTQPGIPTISVRKGNGSFVLTQSSYYKSTTKWDIPIFLYDPHYCTGPGMNETVTFQFFKKEMTELHVATDMADEMMTYLETRHNYPCPPAHRARHLLSDLKRDRNGTIVKRALDLLNNKHKEFQDSLVKPFFRR
ncbi:unnamed protein product, partial [Mesorhabditis spiculigera]